MLIRWLPLFIGLVPLIGVHAAYLIAVDYGYLHLCVPYLDGCTSISATGRYPPASFLFKAVDIDGEAYWDGGYIGNPPLFPLIDETDARDIVIIQINPFTRPEIPRSAYGGQLPIDANPSYAEYEWTLTMHFDTVVTEDRTCLVCSK